MQIDVLVEGPTDEAAARSVIAFCGLEPGVVFQGGGASQVIAKAPGLAVRAQYGGPLLILLDFMDTKIECERDFAASILPKRPERCLLRAVVRELESWCLADAEAVGEFLGISTAIVPREPEREPDPKKSLVNLARRCTNTARRSAIVPEEGFSSATAAGYRGEMVEFFRRFWQPDRARHRSPSLDRCIKRLMALHP